MASLYVRSGIAASICLTFLVVACSDPAAPSRDAPPADLTIGGWEKRAGNPTGTILYGVWSTDDGATVVAAGDDGTIVRSVDGGETWSVTTVGASRFRSLTGTGSLVFAVGDEGLILRSEDAGESWIQVESGFAATLYDVWMVADTVLAVGFNGRILRSTDAGLSWSPVTSQAFQHLRGIWGSGSVWVAVGSSSTVRRSTDGGATWAIVDAGIDANLYGARGSGSNLVAVGTQGAIYRGGMTWSDVGIDPDIHRFDVAGSDSTIVAVGWNGRIVRSLDDGLTWQPMPSGIVQSIRGIWLRGDAIAVGDAGVVLHGEP